MPKVLETFRCYVDRVMDGVAYMRMRSVEFGDTLYGEYPEDKLLEKGIGEQQSFFVRTLKNDDETVDISFELIPKKKVSPERIKEIEDEIERLLPKDCDVDY